MPTLNLVLDTRHSRKAKALHAVCVWGRGKRLRLAVPHVRLSERQWDKARQCAVVSTGRPAEQQLIDAVNQRLAALRQAFDDAALLLPLCPGGLTAETLRASLHPVLHPAAEVVAERLTLPAALRRRGSDQAGYESAANTKAYERLAGRVEAFAQKFGLPPAYLRLVADERQPLAQVDGAFLLRLRDWLFRFTGATNDTVNNALFKLRAALAHVAKRYPQELGGEEGQQRVLLLRQLIDRLPAETPDIFCPTAAELAWLTAAPCPEPLRLTRDRWLLAAGTGLRHSDLALARRDQLRATPEGDVDLHYLPRKTRARKATVIPLGRDVLEIIRTYQFRYPDAEWLVPPQANRADNRLVHEWLRTCGPPAMAELVVRRRYYKEAFVDERLPRYQAITFHSARHCYALQLTGAGADLRLVRDLMGHKNQKSTLRYAQDTAQLSANSGRALLHGPSNS